MEEVLANIMDLFVLGMDGVLEDAAAANFETCLRSRLFVFPFLPRPPAAPAPGNDLEFLLLGGDLENWLPPGGPDPLLVMALLIPPPFVEVENLLL